MTGVYRHFSGVTFFADGCWMWQEKEQIQQCWGKNNSVKK